LRFLPIENAHQNSALQFYTSQARSPFLLLKPASEDAPARLLPRLSWSWTVLPPSDTYRKPITSSTAVLLQFVTHLLTLPRVMPSGLFSVSSAGFDVKKRVCCAWSASELAYPALNNELRDRVATWQVPNMFPCDQVRLDYYYYYYYYYCYFKMVLSYGMTVKQFNTYRI
jgi:hypothetical protein